MEARNQAFVEQFYSEVLSDQHQTQLSLDPAERQEVQRRVVEQAESSTQAALLAAESNRQAQQYEAEGALLGRHVRGKQPALTRRALVHCRTACRNHCMQSSCPCDGLLRFLVSSC